MIKINADHMVEVLRAGGAPMVKAIEYAPHYIDAIDTFGINTPLRLAHFVSQTAHESAGFRTLTEYASGAAYEGRVDLGNTKPGDGKRFRGRGFIQLTGRHNYTGFAKWLKARDIDFDPLATPGEVANLPWAMLATGYYWQKTTLNTLSDGGDTREDVKRVTKRINGGYNGLDDRVSRFVKVMAVIRDLPGFDGLRGHLKPHVEAPPAPDDGFEPEEMDKIAGRPPVFVDAKKGPLVQLFEAIRRAFGTA